MARAGFYAVESGKISFRRDGNWYSDEERIDNPRIALLFSRSIRQNPDGSYYLQVAEERASITVEDTPYVVKAIEGDAQSGFAIVLNDEEREELDPATLEVGPDNVLYCRPAHLYVWVSDDARRVLVRLQVRLRFTIGTITFQLEKEEKT